MNSNNAEFSLSSINKVVKRKLTQKNSLELSEKELIILADIYRNEGDFINASPLYQICHSQFPDNQYAAWLNNLFNHFNYRVDTCSIKYFPSMFFSQNYFFTNQLNSAIINYACKHEHDFTNAKIGKTDVNAKEDSQYRQSLTLACPQNIFNLLVAQINDQFDHICQKLLIKSFEIQKIEANIFNHLHGSFFKIHRDNFPGLESRKINFVYYFFNEPKQFSGGDLLVYDSIPGTDTLQLNKFTKIISENNKIVFFPSEYMHQVTMLTLKNNQFNNGRFTITGHIHD